MSTSLRIAMIGQRGIPATYGGIEHHVEEVSRRLVERGHDVTVFCRPNYNPGHAATHHGINLVDAPALEYKHLEAISHSLVSSARSLSQSFDVIHYHAVGPCLTSPIPRYLSSARVVATVHGLDANRAKWGGMARRALQAGTWMSARVPDETIVVSKSLARHFSERYGRNAVVIPNGVTQPAEVTAGPTMSKYGLEPAQYVLFVGRIVPEKAPDRLIEAFAQLPDQRLKLVLAGDSSFTPDYCATIKTLASQDPRVTLTGYVYGTELAALYANAALFVLPSDVEGLPLTLLEAIAHDVPVLCSDIDPHLEILGINADALTFKQGDQVDLAFHLAKAMANLETQARLTSEIQANVLENHDWEQVVDALEDTYTSVCGGRNRFVSSLSRTK